MTNKPELTGGRTIGSRIATLLAADSVPLSDAWKALIDAADAGQAELQELRRSYLAHRGEIEDVQAQLYEAENRNEANAAMLQAGNSPVTPDCWCRTCRPVTMSDMRFVVCPDCGNKRCPHANDHRNDCTGSNDPGQAGSAYPAAPQQEVTSARVHPARNK